ncbi:ABC transporter ATP-binding protein [Dongia sp.]|uniref:ABC transporter ATP-binding protein n=1 Tax=Dongia sp. TaxID=1977262 RepID=UPI0035B0361C
MTGVQLHNITRNFQRPAPHAVLRALDLTVTPGELLGLVGPSGCGKTTLLRIIAGLDQGFGGTLTWTSGERPKTAMVFQEPRLVPWLSLLDNLLLVTDQARRAEAMALLAEVGLAGHETAFPAQLSGGMQRRAALARALLADPDLLLLDEPFISLDGASAAQMRRLLTTYWQKRGITILLVTHDLPEAIELATRIVTLSPEQGRITADISIPLSYPRRETDPAIVEILSQLRPATRDWPPTAEPPAPTYRSNARSRLRAFSRSTA